jgi:hypothetical protein
MVVVVFVERVVVDGVDWDDDGMADVNGVEGVGVVVSDVNDDDPDISVEFFFFFFFSLRHRFLAVSSRFNRIQLIKELDTS